MPGPGLYVFLGNPNSHSSWIPCFVQLPDFIIKLQRQKKKMEVFEQISLFKSSNQDQDGSIFSRLPIFRIILSIIIFVLTCISIFLGAHISSSIHSDKKVNNIPDAYVKFGQPIITLGDSLTEVFIIVWYINSICKYGLSVELKGWVAQLRATYRRKHDIFNRGYSGYQTDQYASMVRHVLQDIINAGSSPALMTMMIGTK